MEKEVEDNIWMTMVRAASLYGRSLLMTWFVRVVKWHKSVQLHEMYGPEGGFNEDQ